MMVGLDMVGRAGRGWQVSEYSQRDFVADKSWQNLVSRIVLQCGNQSKVLMVKANYLIDQTLDFLWRYSTVLTPEISPASDSATNIGVSAPEPHPELSARTMRVITSDTR